MSAPKTAAKAETVETAATMRERIISKFPPNEYATVFEVRNGTGHQIGPRYCDAMIFGLWPSRGMQVIGVEIKVNRYDWLKELRSPEKADEIGKYCDLWFIAAPDGVVKLEEVPPSWGWWVPRKDSLTIAKQPMPSMDPMPMDRLLVASIVRSACASWQDHPSYLAAIEAADKRIEQERDSAKELARIDVYRLETRIREFEEASGINLSDRDSWFGGAKIGEAVRFVREHLMEDKFYLRGRSHLANLLEQLTKVHEHGAAALVEYEKLHPLRDRAATPAEDMKP